MNNDSNSHRSAEVCGQNSSSEGEGVRKRKRRSGKKLIKEQRFVIYPNNVSVTLSELHKARKRNSTTIPLDDNKTELEIRECLVQKLPQLMGKRFKFFTKGEHEIETPAEWDGKTIKKMARGNKVVYICCQKEGEKEEDDEGRMKKKKMKKKKKVEGLQMGENEETYDIENRKERRTVDEENEEKMLVNSSMEVECSRQSNAISTRVQMHAPRRPMRAGEFLPESAIKEDSLNDEEIVDLVTKVSLEDEKDRLLAQEEKYSSSEEQEEEEGLELEEEEEKDNMQSDNENTFRRSLVNDDEWTRTPMGRPAKPLNSIFRDSAYQSGSTTTVFPGMDAGQRSERPPMMSPLVATGHIETPRNQEQMRTMLSVKIDEITPKEGTVEGGYTFFMTCDAALVTSQVQVMFGNILADPDSVSLIDGKILKGKVPQSPTTGVVQVKLLNNFGENITFNTVPFEYTEQKDKNKAELMKYQNYLDQEVTTPEQCSMLASLVFRKMSEFQSNCKGEKSCDGNSKTRALSLLRMIAESAAKVNAMELFIIIFSTSVGRNVFKSFKNEELSLENIARQNGHEELACFLEERHIKYREDESDSDDEVDWASLAKATKNYQREKVESTGSSSEDSRDYNGDVEDSLSFLSESDEIIETFFEESLDDSEKTSQDNCQEDAQTIIQEEPISCCKKPLPDLPYPLVGRDKECEEIVGNFALNQFRIGVIYGSLGIGKTSVAVEVGHKLLSMGWAVSYHVCSDVESASEIVTPFTNLYHVPNSTTHLKNDNVNETFPVDGTNPTLLILDQVENIIKGNEPFIIIPKALQTLVDVATQVCSVRLLFVSRKRMSLTDDLAFPLELKSLSKASAIQLVESFTRINSQHELELIAKGCGYSPLALMIIRALIQKGIPETEIISKMSFPEHFWKSLFDSVEKPYVSTEAETKWAKRDSFKLRELSGVEDIKETVQMQMFLESWIAEMDYPREVKVDCNEKAFDPRFCQCRLCMSPDGMESLKMALSSSAYIGGSKDLTQENDQHAKSKSQSVGCLGLLVKKLKFLRLLNLEKRAFYDTKETMKKIKEGVQIACVSEQLVTTTSSVSVTEEEHLAASPVSESETENAEELKKTTSIENRDTKSSTTPCTCFRVNLDEEIIAFQPVLDELIPREGRKSKLLKRSRLLLLSKCAVLFVVFLLLSMAAITVLLISQGQTSESNAAPQEEPRGSDVPHQIVNSSVPTTITTILKVNRSGLTNENVSKTICKSETSADCLRSCPADHIEVLNQDSLENECFRCPTCFPGAELSVPCGSIVTSETIIECKLCTFGITFSSSFDDKCQNCSLCQRNETVVRPCRPSADTVCARCGPDQNTWIDTEREIYGCFDCPICSSGFEPSHPCGSVVPHGEMITCVPCQEGKTFSTMKDREACKKCSSCSSGQRMVISCTKYSDTMCRRNCGGDQVTLLKNSRNQTDVECIDCLMCPVGMEPSVACGAVVKNDVALRCVPCSPGVTYSDRRSKHTCRKCTKCPPGNVVIAHCSIHHDTVCSETCLFSQITFSNKSISTCVDCIKCSVGMEPSIPCGGFVNAWPRQQCTHCKPGTFSSSYGTEPCRPCQMCPDETTAKRCTAISDTDCLYCEDAFYLDPFIFSCLPCSSCCNDEKDFSPRECIHFPSRKCQARTCLSNSSHFNYSQFQIRPPKVKSGHITSTQIVRISSSGGIKQSGSAPSTNSSPDSSTSYGPVFSSSVSVLLVGCVFACLFMLVIHMTLRYKYARHTAATLTENSRAETRAREVTGEITLEKLDAKHMDTFEWMCSKLDDGRWGRRDYERLAASFDRIDVEQRAALQCEQIHGRSPTRLLMSLLQTKYPNLPLRYLVHSLKEIGRNDIAKRLTELILEGNYGVSRSIEEISTLF